MLQQVEEDRARSVAAEVERRRVAAENSASQREQRREIERARLLEAERIAQEGEQTKATYMAQEVRAGWGGVVSNMGVIIPGGYDKFCPETAPDALMPPGSSRRASVTG